LHRPHLLCPAVSAKSARPHPDHAQTRVVLGGDSAAGACGSAVVAGGSAAASSLERDASGSALASASSWAAALPLAAAVHAEHLRDLAGFLF